jgi:hypothetical protein
MEFVSVVCFVLMLVVWLGAVLVPLRLRERALHLSGPGGGRGDLSSPPPCGRAGSFGPLSPATRKLCHLIPWSPSGEVLRDHRDTTTAARPLATGRPLPAWPRVADRPLDGPPFRSTLGGSIAPDPQCSVTRGQRTTRKRRHSIPWSPSDGMSALWARKTPTK